MPERRRARAGRIAAWGFAATFVLACLLAWLGLSTERRLALARERLIAGDSAAATAVLSGLRRPLASARAAAGRALASALEEQAGTARRTISQTPATCRELSSFEPEAVLTSALGRRRLASAEAVARLLRGCGHPLGALYEAALLLDRGELLAARDAAASSPVPLASRGIGTRLTRALSRLDAGARALLLDRGGTLVATIDGRGSLRAEAGTAAASPTLSMLETAALPAGARAVRLTCDLDSSRAALDALAGRHGSIVLLDLRTGAVLAAVSDPETARKEPKAAFAQRREPASIAKLLTAAAAYRAGLDADALIGGMRCTGMERYGGRPLWCAWPAGPLSGLDHALAVSCNVAFANLAMRVGRERLLEEYRLWGFDAAATEMLGAAGRIVTPPRTPRELADLAVGLELVDITPLHAALVAATVARTGRMPEARLVAGPCGLLGLGGRPEPAPGWRQVIAPEIAARLGAAMRAVARSGTGAGLDLPEFETAMKTGTGATFRLGYHANYIGVAPLPNPTIAYCIRVTGRRSSPAITADAREVTRRLVAALAVLGNRLPAPGPAGPEPTLSAGPAR